MTVATERIPYTKLCEQPRIDLRSSPLPIPLNLYLEPGNQCNFRCQCCPESLPDFVQKQGGKHMLSWADWESVAGKIEALTPARPILKSLHFYMLGEPLLNKLTTQFIADATARKLAAKTILTTNGTFIGKYAQELSQCGLTYLRVSLYHEYRRYWPKIASGIEVLRHMTGRPFIYVKAFADDNDLGQFRALADEFELVPMMNWNGQADKQLGPEWDGEKTACPMPFYTLVIHSDLRVSVCCVDWDKRLVVGDLRQQTLAEVWDSDEMHRIRLAHLSGKRACLDGCRDCTHLHILQDSVDGLSPMEYTRRVYGTALRMAQ